MTDIILNNEYKLDTFKDEDEGIMYMVPKVLTDGGKVAVYWTIPEEEIIEFLKENDYKYNNL